MEEYGIEVIDLNHGECVTLDAGVHCRNIQLWNEDIGRLSTPCKKLGG
jgi:hypothetical protein